MGRTELPLPVTTGAEAGEEGLDAWLSLPSFVPSEGEELEELATFAPRPMRAVARLVLGVQARLGRPLAAARVTTAVAVAAVAVLVAAGAGAAALASSGHPAARAAVTSPRRHHAGAPP